MLASFVLPVVTMKKIILGLCILVGAVASANIAPPETRLKVENYPLQNEGVLRGVEILSDGQVIYFEKASEHSENFVKRVPFARLGTTEQQYIDDKIELAREAKLESHNAICRALPTQGLEYTADNESIPLMAAQVPCGGRKQNNSLAAGALIEILNRYLRARN